MKNLKELETIGFTLTKNNMVAYGTISSYTFVLNFLPQQNEFILSTSVAATEDNDTLSSYMETIDKEKYQYINGWQYAEDILTLHLNIRKLEINVLHDFLNELAAHLLTNRYVACCHKCHQEKGLHVYSINGNVDVLCEDCYFQACADASQDIKPVNMPLGIVGALIGSLIGVAAWIIIYKLGYVAGITGFIMAICCFKGYEMLGGRIDKKGLWIALFISVVMLAVAEYFALGMEIYSLFNDYYGISIIEAMQSIPDFLQEGEIMAGMVKDLLFGYVFMIAASFTYIKNVYHKVNTQGVCERLDA